MNIRKSELKVSELKKGLSKLTYDSSQEFSSYVCIIITGLFSIPMLFKNFENFFEKN
jgi:hypothetical protein